MLISRAILRETRYCATNYNLPRLIRSGQVHQQQPNFFQLVEFSVPPTVTKRYHVIVPDMTFI